MWRRLLNPKLEVMPSADTAWLRMDTDTNLMMIVGITLTKERVDLKTLRAVVQKRFLSYKRFRQRVVQDFSAAYYEDDPHFDIRHHVARIGPKTPIDKAGLQDLVSELATDPLDSNRPLWRLDLVDTDDGGSALVTRIHHCYADGISLIQVFFSMADTEPGPPRLEAPSHRRRRRSNGGHHHGPASLLASTTLKITRGLWKGSMHAVRRPDEAIEGALTGVDMAAELVGTTLTPTDSATRFKGHLVGRKRAAWAEPISLEEVKVVGKALGCTVNDVLLASAAGALGSYLRDKGDDTDGVEMRATVPVNLRGKNDDFSKLGNKFGLVFLDLPIGIDNPMDRLFVVHRRMKALKSSKQPIVVFGLLSVIGRGPAALQTPLQNFFASKATAVMTNVPGPQQPFYFAGAEVSQLMFWVPQSGSIGMGISILSYNGQVQFGLITDVDRVPDPDEVISRFRPEFEKLLYAILLEDWENPGTPAETDAMLARLREETARAAGTSKDGA